MPCNFFVNCRFELKKIITLEGFKNLVEKFQENTNKNGNKTSMKHQNPTSWRYCQKKYKGRKKFWKEN